MTERAGVEPVTIARHMVELISQNAEKRGEKGIDFFEFAKYGIPFTLITLIIYWGYFAILS